MATAIAQHILVTTLEKCQDIQKQLQNGAKFEDMAARYSSCSSGDRGGDLGEFGPGSMVRQLDDLIFKDKVALNVVHGPIQTEFGYHLLLITKRTR